MRFIITKYHRFLYPLTNINVIRIRYCYLYRISDKNNIAIEILLLYIHSKNKLQAKYLTHTALEKFF